ncbi:MAG: FlgD immunoglobulin-like domain containing protein [Candidatus Eisenbacteria bacterium]|nr:FlgD immunoglobulin-like domain containing protein [Candidatus Eisenbacteria bacterium]
MKIVAYDKWLNSSSDTSDSLFAVGSATEAGATQTLTAENFELLQNFPNPFEPMTQISFAVPGHTKVSLHVFSAEGRLVRTLLNKEVVKGRHSIGWNGRDDGGRLLPHGIYFVRLSSKEGTAVRKAVLLR